GNAYIGGDTDSSDFPIQSAYQSTDHGNREIFITKLNPSGSALVFSTYLGGSDNDYCRGIAVDSSGNIYLASASYGGFPVTVGAYQTTYNGNQDAVAVKMAASGSSLDYATYLGGSGYDSALAVAVDGSGHAYLTGDTYSSDFPVYNAYQDTISADDDAF